MVSSIAERASTLLKSAVVSTSPMAGGMICTATRLLLSDGSSAVFKTHPRAPKGFFETEAAGLATLAQSDGVKVPKVLAVAEDCLILEWIETGRPSVIAAEHFARSLAATHEYAANTFGGTSDGFIGLLPLPNRPTETWIDFFTNQRVLPYLKVAVDRAAITLEEALVIETLLSRLDEFAGEAQKPALVHGDLWNGNVIWAAQGLPHVIDPAVHGGHRESDLAMLALFGLPFLDHVFDAYNEASPLAEGWKSRLPIHQLHPLLVHAVIFGGSYGQRAAANAKSVLNGES